MNVLALQGFALVRDVMSTIRRVEGARIAVLAAGLDVAKPETKGTVLITEVCNCHISILCCAQFKNDDARAELLEWKVIFFLSALSTLYHAFSTLYQANELEKFAKGEEEQIEQIVKELKQVCLRLFAVRIPVFV